MAWNGSLGGIGGQGGQGARAKKRVEYFLQNAYFHLFLLTLTSLTTLLDHWHSTRAHSGHPDGRPVLYDL